MTTQVLTYEPPTDRDFVIGHLTFTHSPYVALCGKKLKGIVLDDTAELCVVCGAIAHGVDHVPS